MNVNDGHPAFPQPDDAEFKVWRYLSLPKFVLLLKNSALHLSRLDQFNDLHEGAFPVSMILTRDSRYQSRERIRWSEFMNMAVKEEIFVSCWALLQNESEALWKTYGGMEEGIAIQSTYSKIRGVTESVDNAYIGRVQYIDYDSDSFDAPDWPFVYNLLQPIMHKRKAFEYENEVRIVKWKPIVDGKKNLECSLSLEIDLDETIESIYINPYAKSWYFDAVHAVVNKFQPSLVSRLKWSKMREKPRY